MDKVGSCHFGKLKARVFEENIWKKMANRHFRGGGALKAEAVAEMIHGKSMKRCAVTRAVCEASALWHANP